MVDGTPGRRYSVRVLDEIIETERLQLILLRPDTLRALMSGDPEAASRAQGLWFTDEWTASLDTDFLRVQLGHMEAHTEARAWCVRAVVRRTDGAVIGHAGFHGPPVAVGRAEIGYTILPATRRRGYATEAARALVDWARAEGEQAVFASVAPSNAASLGVVRTVGFAQTGDRVDDVDGEEQIFELTLSAVTSDTNPCRVALIREVVSHSDLTFLRDMFIQAAYWNQTESALPDVEDALQRPELAAYFSDWGRVDDYACLAESQTGSLVGAAWSRRFSQGERSYGFVSPDVPEMGIAVVASCRRLGVGRSLLQHLLADAHRRGLRAISLSVDKANPSVHLYQTAGFRTVEESSTHATMVLDL